jgi:hypothetical protein
MAVDLVETVMSNLKVSESHENAMSTVFPTPYHRILRNG